LYLQRVLSMPLHVTLYRWREMIHTDPGRQPVINVTWDVNHEPPSSDGRSDGRQQCVALCTTKWQYTLCRSQNRTSTSVLWCGVASGCHRAGLLASRRNDRIVTRGCHAQGVALVAARRLHARRRARSPLLRAAPVPCPPSAPPVACPAGIGATKSSARLRRVALSRAPPEAVDSVGRW